MFPGTWGRKILHVNHDFQTSTCVEIWTCVVLSQKKTLTLHEFLNFLLEVRGCISLVPYNDFCNSPTIGHAGPPPSSSRSSTAISFFNKGLVKCPGDVVHHDGLGLPLNAESKHFSTVAASDTSNLRASNGAVAANSPSRWLLLNSMATTLLRWVGFSTSPLLMSI